MKSSFDVGQEGWCSYDYNGCIRADRRIMVLAEWEPEGGADGGGYVWADEHGWSADTPESPVSVLPLMLYRYWVDEGPLDLRGARVSVYLRGDGLELFGARCYFWVVGSDDRGRWHYDGAPLEISDGRWADEPNVITLHNDEELWRRSWSKDPDNPALARRPARRMPQLRLLVRRIRPGAQGQARHGRASNNAREVVGRRAPEH